MNTCTKYEGEVIYREKFGSSSVERLYVKPPEQSGIVIVPIAGPRNVSGWFTKIFLPQGYPDSVSKDYLAYQIWDTAQAFCSTISGILATQEVLRGVGVGDKNATPLAATITWVLKDGCGHIGKILFAYTHGIYLDSYSKKWRMYADILNNAAMCIEISLPQFKVYSLFALCVSTMMKAIVGVAGGATRVAMTQHHAIMGNLADVSAKDSAQETAVNLVASLASLAIIGLFGSSLTIFMLMMVLHVIFNYFAVRAVCLRTLNEPRFLLIIEKYLRHEIIATPCEINRKEPVIFYQLGPCILDLKISGFQIKLGSSMKQTLGRHTKAEYLIELKKVYSEVNYILVPRIEHRTLHVLVKQAPSADDILRSYFHAVLLAIITCAINDEPLTVYKNYDNRPFAQVCAMLQSSEWSREEARLSNSRFAYNPSSELLVYLNKIVAQEWPRVSSGLRHTGWDLTKQLLIVDQWRVSKMETTIKHISIDKTEDSDFDIINNIPTLQSYKYSNDIMKEFRAPNTVNMSGNDNTVEPHDTSSSPRSSVGPVRTSIELEKSTNKPVVQHVPSSGALTREKLNVSPLLGKRKDVSSTETSAQDAKSKELNLKK